MIARGKARPFKPGDVVRQRPERDRRGRAETVADAFPCQIRRDRRAIGQTFRRLFRIGRGQIPALCPGQLPGTGGKAGLTRLDPGGGQAGFIHQKEGHAQQFRAIGVRPFGLDHRLAARIPLPQPQAVGRDRKHAGPGIGDAGLRAVMQLDRGGNQRVQHCHRHQPAGQRRQHRRDQEAQPGPARRAHHDQFARTRQRHEQRDGGQDDDQGQDAIQAFRHVQRGQLQRRQKARIALVQAAQLVDRVDQQHDAEEDPQHHRERGKEPPRDVKAQRHAAAPPRRRRRGLCARCSSSAAMPSPATGAA